MASILQSRDLFHCARQIIVLLLLGLRFYTRLQNNARFPEISLNPLRPNNDLSQTSPCNIKGLSVTEVLRIENMITQIKILLIFEQLLPTTSVRNVWKHKRRICNLILGLKGLILHT